VVADVGCPELGRRPIVVPRLAVGTAEGLVLGGAVGPVLQILGRVILEVGDLLLSRLLLLLEVRLLLLLLLLLLRLFFAHTSSPFLEKR